MQQEFLEVKVEEPFLKTVILSVEMQLNREPILLDDGRRIS